MIRNLQSLSSSNEKSDTSRRDHLLQLAAWYRARAARGSGKPDCNGRTISNEKHGTGDHCAAID
jgi:hypothetical protein